MDCPNCSAAMEERSFDRHYGRSVALDICHPCQAIWFDGMELLQLAPGATLQLVSALRAGARGARTPLATLLRCPRCPAKLVETHDLQRSTRFTFFRCRAGHGRFLTFYQFLRAKNFVRTLDAQEIAELRRRIRQVNCSNCGAPVNIERHAACAFCRSPIVMLDPDQVQKVVAELQAAEERRRHIDPTLPIQLLAERAHVERAFAVQGERAGLLDFLDAGRAPSLVEAGLRAFADWVAHRSDPS